MSFHAHLSDTAREAYAKQQRDARFSSFLGGILGTILLALILIFWTFKTQAVREHGFKVEHATLDDDPPPTPRVISTARQPNPAPGGASAPVLVAHRPSDLAIPVPDLVLPTESTPFGMGDGLDMGEIGRDGTGPSPGQGPVTTHAPRHRCSQRERLAKLAESGGSPEIEPAVVRSLRWFKATQNADGSWGDSHKAGMTGLALLAYLGHCETPVSEEFGESCTDAIVFLLDRAARHNGKIATDFKQKHWPYEHAIATYALAEALSFARVFGYNIPGHRDAVQNAGQWMIDNQHQSGGWDYAYEEAGSRGGDLSITGWHLQSLKACKTTGLEFRNLGKCVREALAYVEGQQATDGGFGYTGTTPAGGLAVHSLTGVGTLSFQIWEKASHSAARKGVKYLRSKADLDYNGSQCDLYAHYYHSQALRHAGGEAWTKYNASFAPQLLAAQQAEGAFVLPGGGAPLEAVAPLFTQNSAEGVLYRTCLCTLMLEVYYRYLPGTGK